MELDSVHKLTKDLKEASITLSRDEARFLVDAYYSMQHDRIRAGNQVRALTESGEPHEVLNWLMTQSSTLEKQVARALDAYSNSVPVGAWSRSIVGIGPVIAAGLLAHIDITRAPTVGHIWRFAGLDPTQTWERGQKRPWNASLKTLCWKIGESFVKVKGNKDDVYGKFYDQRKEFEQQQNEAGAYREQAEAVLARVPNHKQKAVYATGKLPDGHIHARAKRYAVKLFLAHWHHQAYRFEYNQEPPLPYAIAHLDHAHHILPPE